MPNIDTNHNHPPHIKVLVAHHKVKRVLVDNGSALNLCTLKFIKKIWYTQANLSNQIITVKAYDNVERDSEGIVSLPIQVGLVI